MRTGSLLDLDIQIQSLLQLPKSVPQLNVSASFNTLYADYVENSPLLEYLESIPRWAWVSGCLLGAAVCFYIRHDRVYGYWKRQGVPGPTPLPVFGNSLDTVKAPSIYALNKMWFDKYGHKGYVGSVLNFCYIQ